jgi:DNA processing protein
MPLTTSIPELTDWLRLQATPGVGPETARKLLAIFGLPSNIFNASFTALNRFVSDRVARALLTAPSSEALELIDKTIVWCQEKNNYVLTLADVHYPKSLFTIPDPPMILYVKGRVELLGQTAMAVVGSRHATQQGMMNANRFAEVLSQAGLTIVSGLAQGIDTAAHEGGLNGSSSTIAVIGTGADIVYPAKNRALAHKIAEQGCIISEYSLGMPAIATNFPRRNRIISGLSRGVLLVEAALQSGSLITARMAAEQGREVFAIPGSIHSPLAKGCHQLIKQGAKLVESAQDIVEELHMRSPLTKPESIAYFEDETNLPHPILHAMGFDPIHIDTLAQRLMQDAASLNGELFALELDGLIERLPNGSYRRLH